MTSPTIVDIAQLAGVSFKTVARVINKEPSVKAETRERVEAIIEKLNYRPNVWARTLRSSRSHLISLMFDYPRAAPAPNTEEGENVFSSSYYMQQMHLAAMDVSQTSGYHLFMEQVSNSGRSWEKNIRQIIKSTHLDGVVLVPPLSDNLALLKLLKAEEVCFVRVGATKHLDIVPYVHMDDRLAAYQAVSLLCDLGHHDIGIVKGPDEHGSSRERFQGYADALRERGLEVNTAWCVGLGSSNAKLGMEAGDTLLKQKPRPTAIFAFNDETAIGVMSAALRRGLKVPEDVSVIGFDDSPLAGMLWPGLTTIHQPVVAMAQRATEMLIAQIENREPPKGERFDFRLVKRGTAGKAPVKRAKKSVQRKTRKV